MWSLSLNANIQGSEISDLSFSPIISKIFEAIVLRSVSSQLELLLGPKPSIQKLIIPWDCSDKNSWQNLKIYLDDSKVQFVRMIHGVCVDLRKAFNKIPHSVLNNLLIKERVRPGFILWDIRACIVLLKSYLLKWIELNVWSFMLHSILLRWHLVSRKGQY